MVVPGDVELYRLIGFASSEFTLSCGSATEFVNENLTAMIRPVVSSVISGMETSFGDVSAAVAHVANGIAFATSALAFHADMFDEPMPYAGLDVNTGSVSVNEVSGVMVLEPSVMVPLDIFASVIPYPEIVVGVDAISENV